MQCTICGGPTSRSTGICKDCERASAAGTQMYAQPAAPAGPIIRGDAVCTNCGHHGPAALEQKGGCAVELALWLFFLFPGLIYSVWRRTNQRLVCRQCGSPLIVSDRTPEGQRVLAEHARAAEVDAARASAPIAPPDLVGQLERLADLRDRSILSDEEFQAQKRRLLEG